jgi:hypothetical protein
VDLRDRNGDPVANAQKFVKIQFLWRLSEGDLLTEPESVAIEDVGNGSYNVTYTLQDPGKYDLLITIQDTHITGSPFEVDISPRLSCLRGSKYSEKVDVTTK